MGDYTTAMNHMHKFLLDMSQDPAKAKGQLFELIRVCIEEEREVCAKVAETTLYCDGVERRCGTGDEIAKRIRERR